jgi:hypothetical protein
VAEPDPVRDASSHLFGQVCKLEVLALIAQEPTEVFHHGDLISRSGRTDSASGYHKALSDLVAAGLLLKLPRNGHRQPYRRVDYEIWHWADVYVTALRGSGLDRHLHSINSDDVRTA